MKKTTILGLIIAGTILFAGACFIPTIAEEEINLAGIWYHSSGTSNRVIFREDGTGAWAGFDPGYDDFTYVLVDSTTLKFFDLAGNPDVRDFEYIHQYEIRIEINGVMQTFYEYQHVPQ